MDKMTMQVNDLRAEITRAVDAAKTASDEPGDRMAMFFGYMFSCAHIHLDSDLLYGDVKDIYVAFADLLEVSPYEKRALYKPAE